MSLQNRRRRRTVRRGRVSSRPPRTHATFVQEKGGAGSWGLRVARVVPNAVWPGCSCVRACVCARERRESLDALTDCFDVFPPVGHRRPPTRRLTGSVRARPGRSLLLLLLFLFHRAMFTGAPLFVAYFGCARGRLGVPFTPYPLICSSTSTVFFPLRMVS